MNSNQSIAVECIMRRFRSHQKGRVFTIAISGIDAAGKGYMTNIIAEKLKEQGLIVALINTDPWQNPIPMRLKKENAAMNLYENIFRWDDLFEQLIFPLQQHRKIYLETKGIQTDKDTYYPLLYDHDDIDVLLLEGIFLFKQEYLSIYDYRIWIDCSFETGIKRALERNIEKLAEEMLLYDYNTFYYPAQRYHFEMDHPKEHADLVIDNN